MIPHSSSELQLSFLNTSDDEIEITEDEWRKLWTNFKLEAETVLNCLRTLVNIRIDMAFDAEGWELLKPIIQFQPKLEMLIRDSGPETGWIQNPLPLFQELIQAVAEMNQVDFNARLEELKQLKMQAEVILIVR
jgi:hypothetical protein